MTAKRLLPVRVVLSFLLFLLTQAAWSQDRVVTGKVTDSQTGAPIAGASVVPKGSTSGTTTDAQGAFRLNVPARSNALIISYIGFSAQEITIRGAVVNIALSPQNNSLNEVVVVGYGTQRKKDLTASISKIGSDKIASVPAPSFESALAGKAAGVQVTTTSGMAGSGAVIRIRGINSISIPGDPLYVIDGLPIDVTYLNGPTRNNLGQDRNPLANLNPSDIESIEILKDAGAAGIYGSRGANGVVLITTKRGRGKMRHNFSARVGISGPTVEPKFVDKDTWLAIRQEAWEFDGNTGPQKFLPGLNNGNTGFPLDRALNNPGTDWWDLATRQGFSHDYNYSVSKGLGKFSFYAGGNYGKEQSYIEGNDYQRIGARVNLDYKPTKNLTLSLNNSFNNGVSNLLNNAWNGGLGLAMSTGLPYYPVYNPDGSYFRTDNYRTTWDFGAGNNLVAQRESSDFRTRENRWINSLVAKYTVMKNLDIGGTISYEQNNSLYNSYKNTFYVGRNTPGTGENSLNKYKNFSYNFTANYVLELKNDSRFTFLAGTEYQDQETINRYAYFDTVLAPLYDGGKTQYIKDSIDRARSTTTYQRLFRSVFARVNYSYKGKYILQGSLRRDESSVFRDNNRVGWFPTVSGAWVMTDEKFFPHTSFIDAVKLRASWGLFGSANIPWDAGYASFDTSRTAGNNYNGIPTIFRRKLGNPDLKWETSTNIDVALEATLFNNRVNFELGYYRKQSKDVLLEVPISLYDGYDDRQWQNQGSILNEGVEFNINTTNIKTSTFSWTSNFNIARNYNEVLSIGDIRPDALSGGTNETRIVKGYPVGTIFTVRYAGVDPNDGLPIFYDANGKTTKTLNAPDGVLGDRVPVANTLPEFYGGLTNTFRYKSFELNTVFTYQFGGYTWDNSGKRNLGWITDWNIYSFYVGNYWRKPGDVAKYPRPTITGYAQSNAPGDVWRHNSSIQVFKSDFVRLRELTFNYYLPQKLVNRWKMSNAKLFLTGYNVLLFTEYPVGDPESGRDGENDAARNQSGNANFLNPPLQRSLTFGLNISF